MDVARYVQDQERREVAERSEEESHRKEVVKREVARDEDVVWTARGVTRKV